MYYRIDFTVCHLVRLPLVGGDDDVDGHHVGTTRTGVAVLISISLREYYLYAQTAMTPDSHHLLHVIPQSSVMVPLWSYTEPYTVQYCTVVRSVCRSRRAPQYKVTPVLHYHTGRWAGASGKGGQGHVSDRTTVWDPSEGTGHKPFTCGFPGAHNLRLRGSVPARGGGVEPCPLSLSAAGPTGPTRATTGGRAEAPEKAARGPGREVPRVFHLRWRRATTGATDVHCASCGAVLGFSRTGGRQATAGPHRPRPRTGGSAGGDVLSLYCTRYCTPYIRSIGQSRTVLSPRLSRCCPRPVRSSEELGGPVVGTRSPCEKTNHYSMHSACIPHAHKESAGQVIMRPCPVPCGDGGRSHRYVSDGPVSYAGRTRGIVLCALPRDRRRHVCRA